MRVSLHLQTLSAPPRRQIYSRGARAVEMIWSSKKENVEKNGLKVCRFASQSAGKKRKQKQKNLNEWKPMEGN